MMTCMLFMVTNLLYEYLFLSFIRFTRNTMWNEISTIQDKVTALWENETIRSRNKKIITNDRIIKQMWSISIVYEMILAVILSSGEGLPQINFSVLAPYLFSMNIVVNGLTSLLVIVFRLHMDTSYWVLLLRMISDSFIGGSYPSNILSPLFAVDLALLVFTGMVWILHRLSQKSVAQFRTTSLL